MDDQHWLERRPIRHWKADETGLYPGDDYRGTEGKLDTASFEKHPVFSILMPAKCEGVPANILNPKNTWADKAMYDAKAKELARLFITNFKQYESGVSEAILAAAPVIK